MREIGVFLPIARNGYLISSASPQYSPAYDLNRDVAIAAERYGFDFALAMIKLRGYGGVTRHWDECLEAFTDGRLGCRHQAHPVFSLGCGFDDAAAVCGPHGRDDRLGGAGTMRHQHCFRLAKGGIRADGNLAGRGPLSAALPILRGVYADFAGALGDREKRLQRAILSNGRLPPWTIAVRKNGDCLRRPERFGGEICRQIWRLQLYQRELH